MRKLVSAFAALGLAALAAPAFAQAQLTAPPAPLLPSAVSGVGFNVTDLEAEKTWYSTMLGMEVIATVPATGPVREYVMSFKGAPSARLSLLKAPRPPGPNGFGYAILTTPDPKALSAYLYAHGSFVREAIPDIAYFVTDPEGNAIELYKPRAAR